MPSSDYTDYSEYWVDWFLEAKGHEYFCDVSSDYIRDRFNLTGLNAYVDRISLLVDIITDVQEIRQPPGQDESVKQQLEENAKFLYALIHARYILTSKGLSKMMEKYRHGDFGMCPRVNCQLTHLLPIGLSDTPRVSSVKLYCPNCEDIYNPKSSRHSSIDGAFFGTSFAAMFLQTYPELVPVHNVDVFVPKIFGFKMHEQADLQRWRENERLKVVQRLQEKGIDCSENVPGGYAKPTPELRVKRGGNQ